MPSDSRHSLLLAALALFLVALLAAGLWWRPRSAADRVDRPGEVLLAPAWPGLSETEKTQLRQHRAAFSAPVQEQLFACTRRAMTTVPTTPAPPEGAPGPVAFFVAPEGLDAWSGLLPVPNTDRTDGPFATPGRAQQAVRQVRAQLPAPRTVSVVLRAGTYALDAPLLFDARDGGPPLPGGPRPARPPPVTWMAYPGETVTLSGGRRLTGWREETQDGRRVWTTELPLVRDGRWSFRQLFVNGRRRFRPRLPRTGFYQMAAVPGLRPNLPLDARHREFTAAPGDFQPWRNLTDIEVVALHYWVDSHFRVLSFDPATNVVRLDRESVFSLNDESDRTLPPAYYVDNVAEALTQPGDWYLDRPTGRLSYLPLPGEDLVTAVIVAPVLSTLVEIAGQLDQPVTNLVFAGLSFAHTEWTLPPHLAGFEQAAAGVPGAVVIRQAANVVVRQCQFRGLGGYGVEVLGGGRELAIIGNDFIELGAGAVKVWHGAERVVVSDNEIGPGGQVFHNAVGILIGRSNGNEVRHNHVHHFCYTGISVGWVWGYGSGNAFGNVVADNHIHDIGQGWLSDLGGIYLIGPSQGTRLIGNVIHDVRHRRRAARGLYTDEGTCGAVIENNLVYRCDAACYHHHYGADNLVQNNIFVDGGEAQFSRSEPEGQVAFTMARNIVWFRHGTLLGGDFGQGQARFDANLYWDARPQATPDFSGRTLAQWQALGQDVHSLVADPLFVDPAHDDFRLCPESPAFHLGFREYDFSAVGPRADFRRPPQTIP